MLIGGTVARDKVANVLLASKGRGAAGGPAHTAQDLARSIARELLGPLLETACYRLASLLRHAFDIAADSQALLQGNPINSGYKLSVYLLRFPEAHLFCRLHCFKLHSTLPRLNCMSWL